MRKILAGGVVLTLVSVAFADAVLPDLAGPGPWLGQSDMTSDYSRSSVADIDWIVLPPGNYAGTGYEQLARAVFGSTTANHYLYAYQIESNMQNLNRFSIQSPNMLNGGFAPNHSLDTYGWGDHNLPGENEPPSQSPLQNPTGVQMNVNATWSFGPGLDRNAQSSIMWFTSDLRPSYGNGGVQDSIPPNPARGMMPVPVPAPGAALLGALGLAGLLLHRRA